MPKQDYTYAVARVRALENSLLNQDDINQLLACPGEDEAVEWLLARGWGNGETAKDGETILDYEYRKTWKIAAELVKNMSALDVLCYINFHTDLKGAIKKVALGKDIPDSYVHIPFYTEKELMSIIRNEEWFRFPDFIQDSVREAYETILETGNGQLLDVMVDRICLESYARVAETAEHEIIRKYAEETVAVTDIKIAVRCARSHKGREFMDGAMIESPKISKDSLIQAALTGEGAVMEYLETTEYRAASDSLKRSLSAFECWCDNRIVELMRPQLRNSFTIGPVFAYIYARENEIRSVRNILMGKRSMLPVEDIRERVREMYV